MQYYKYAPDLNVTEVAKKRPAKRERQRDDYPRHATGNQQFTRFFLNVGRRDGIMPQGLLGKINDASGVGRIKVGKIDIMRNSVLLEAESRFAPQILSAFQHMKVNGKTVSFEVAREKKHGTGPSRPKRGGIRTRKSRNLKVA